jgi:hypothetical protein
MTRFDHLGDEALVAPPALPILAFRRTVATRLCGVIVVM